jgi:hypothetical protein
MIVSKPIEIEQYKPNHCFRCSLPIYIRAYEGEDGYFKSFPFDFYTNRHHLCNTIDNVEEITIKNRA